MPQLLVVFNYTVNTTGPCVTPSTTGTITVTPDGTINNLGTRNRNQTVCINTRSQILPSSEPEQRQVGYLPEHPAHLLAV
ncbi:MAG: hypothetical protein IPP43_00490 [Chitinophagaceae bacterium]|nr:hypothetical protein [Chitinophagaceae bacterium]